MSRSPDRAEAQDAAPSKPIVPRLSLRPLKTLAPKPPPSEPPVLSRSAAAATTSSLAAPRTARPCPVCRRKACSLTSHKAWLRARKRIIQPGDGAAPPQNGQHVVKDASYNSSYAYRFTQSFVDVNIAAGRVDPFYMLPVPESTHPQLHRLFHDFFTVQLDRAMAIPRPSCFTSDPVGGVLAPAAMIDPAVCLSVISMSATCAGMRIGQQARNASAKLLYGQATQMLRDRLAICPSTDGTILAAATLWIVSVHFGNESIVRQNRNVVRDLVRKRGGPLQLGMAGVPAQYVAWAEILTALWLNEEPDVVNQETPGILVDPPAAIYGAAFHSPHIVDCLHPTILEISFTICRLTEVQEKAIRAEPTPRDYIYFYSTLQWVSIQRARFRASRYNSGTKDECVGNAIEIYRNNVFSTQPEMNILNLAFCSQLQRALMQTNLTLYWAKHVDLLIWVLFVAVTIECEWESKQWFMNLLHRSISCTYANEDWPDLWREEALQNLKSFVWSERLSQNFVKICDELDRTLGLQAKTGPDPLLVTTRS